MSTPLPPLPSNPLAKYIYLLTGLPEQPFLLTTASEQYIFQTAKFRYRALSLWLRHLLLGEALATEAFLSDMQYYQPLAEFMAAEFRLAVGVHPRSGNPLIRSFESPADLWFSYQRVMSQQCLESGLTDCATGKQAWISTALECIKVLDDTGIPYRQMTEIDDITMALVAEAQEIARADIDFRCDYFIPYLRAFKRFVNKDKNCKYMQSLYLLPNGQLHWTGKNAKLPKRDCKGK